MLAVSLALSALLPLLAGMPWLLLAQRHETGPGRWPIAIGYGYVLGLLVVVSGMRLLAVLNLPIGIFSASALPIVAAAIGWWRTYRFTVQDFCIALRSSRFAWTSMPRATRIVSGLAILFVALRFATLTIESLARPIFPWEAVSSVAAKARIWYESGMLVPFVQPVAILQGIGSYTDADPSAFALPSLLLVWTANAIGRWHEGAVAFAWVMLGVALALAFYGHLRRAGGGIAYALVFTYVLVSLPLIDMHVALSGAPQWIAAAGVGVSGCAFLRWLQSPVRSLLLCSVIGALFAVLALPTTWPWIGIFLVAGIIQRFPAAAGKLAVGIPLIALIAMLALMQTPLTLGGRVLQVTLAAEWAETPESLLLLDNWHLLFVVLLLIAIAGWRHMFSSQWRAMSWVVGMGLGLMLVKGILSLPPYWFGGLRDFSYAGLQLAPILLMWIALFAHDIAIERPVRSAEAANT